MISFLYFHIPLQHHAQLPDKGPCNAADSPVNEFEALEQQVVGGPTQVNDLGDPTACSTIEEPTADIDNVDISKKQPQVTLFNFVRGGGVDGNGTMREMKTFFLLSGPCAYSDDQRCQIRCE